MEKTESPIETKFLHHFLYLKNDVNVKGIDIKAQVKVGKYRVDFMITGNMPATVVECDGHDWHEKSREQAAKDKKRDRFLQSQGFRVFHFTGSEIHKKGLFCVIEAIQPAFNSHARSFGLIA